MSENETPESETTDDRLIPRRQVLAAGGALAAAGAIGSVVAGRPAFGHEHGGSTTTTAADGSTTTSTTAATTTTTAAPGNTPDEGDLAPQTLQSISLAQAKALVEAAEAESTRIGVPMYILVIDVGGDEKASSRQDGNGKAGPVLVPPKAQTALAFRTATLTLAGRTTDPARISSFVGAGFSLVGGGVPITSGDNVIGAIGIGGGTQEQDHEVAIAALAAVGLT